MSDLEDRVAYLERRMAQLVGPPEQEAAVLASQDQSWASFNESMKNVGEKLGELRQMRDEL